MKKESPESEAKSEFKPVVIGCCVWLAMLAVPAHGEVGLGVIERMFLLAPLVLVPLALPLLWPRSPSAATTLICGATHLQPGAAVLAALSFLFPCGCTAGMLAIPWTGWTWVVGTCGLIRLFQFRFNSIAETCFVAAMLMLPVGGIGFIQSRFGASPLGFHEPWVLLVAVHFHYAAFVAPILVGMIGRQLVPVRSSSQPVKDCRSGFYDGTAVPREKPPWKTRLGRLGYVFVAMTVIAGSPLMAAGFVFHAPWARTLAALLLGAGMLGQSILTLSILPRLRPQPARLLLAVSALSIVAAMWLAILFTLGDLRGEVWISIPQMARTHGILNGFGFSLCGLIGWNLACRKEARETVGATTRRPQTLVSRWE